MAPKSRSKTTAQNPRHKSSSQIEIWLQEIEFSAQDDENILAPIITSPSTIFDQKSAQNQHSILQSTTSISPTPPTTNQVTLEAQPTAPPPPQQQNSPSSSSLWRKLSPKSLSSSTQSPTSTNTTATTNKLTHLARKLSLTPKSPQPSPQTKMYSHTHTSSPNQENSNKHSTTTHSDSDSSLSISTYNSDEAVLKLEAKLLETKLMHTGKKKKSKGRGRDGDEESDSEEDITAKRKRERLERAARLLGKVQNDAVGGNTTGIAGNDS